jgi:acyl-CoA synthetase (AMP-forming)/AMP-acid ligase II
MNNLGNMQAWPLTVNRFCQQAARWHPNREIVSRSFDGEILRGTYRTLECRARRISSALLAAGVKRGDRVATMAFNGFDHLALWYGIMGIGAVCHTLNPRLPPSQLRYIAGHAGDSMLFVDEQLGELAKDIASATTSIRQVVRIGAAGEGSLDSFLNDAPHACRWGDFDENLPAGLCYTSGTTGNPKGVAYTHRSNSLHALITVAPDGFGLSANDVIMPVVPMFHANSWGLAFSAPYVGAKLVLPGPLLDGASLHHLIEEEGVTFSAGVPTVWQGYVDHLRSLGISRTSLQRVVIGGSACPTSLFDALGELGASVIHAWGMTELSPVGLVALETPDVRLLAPAERRTTLLKQGRPLGIDARIVDDDGVLQPRDGHAVGHLEVRGPAVLERYAGEDRSCLSEDGWFDTGDIASIDNNGFVQITDRAKDIIKSGGEWISSVDVENAAMSHPNVTLAAAIAMPHPRWGERPKLYLQLREPSNAPPEHYREHLAALIERWWLPDEVEIVESIPLGATGKIDKKALRALSRSA